jgi:predicted nuclease of restriction endonuclease-like (RecB) superfamily
MKNKPTSDNLLYNKIVALIEAARQKVATTVNLAMVYTYFEVGRTIVEDEQEGKTRAGYGKHVLKDLSKRLTEKFGQGFSVENLDKMRFFYKTYTLPISSTLSTKLTDSKTNTIYETPSRKFILSWSHYLILMRIKNLNERSFYEIECAAQNWGVKQLNRQYQSSLYERLALSRDKEEVMKLATHGQTMDKATDILKNPLTLDFLGLEEKAAYTESDLEHAIISKIQQFLLELGKGFLFEARQKRFTFDEEHFYVDLVFYNRLLQCYVLIDLKTDKLVHQDLGQMQMYVNYYDRNVKLHYEKPTIGILLCKKKNDAIVELTLPEDANIYATEYNLYLPDKQLPQQKLTEWLIEFDAENEIENNINTNKIPRLKKDFGNGYSEPSLSRIFNSLRIAERIDVDALSILFPFHRTQRQFIQFKPCSAPIGIEFIHQGDKMVIMGWLNEVNHFVNNHIFYQILWLFYQFRV